MLCNPRFALTVLFAITLSAQQIRIARPVDNNERVPLQGHVHPKARPENDLGRVAPSLELPSVTLLLAPSESQKADLDKLLADQQDPASPNYHRWLTPEEYAQRFGVSNADLAKIAAWIETQGLTVQSIARGRNSIVCSGTAAQVEAAFQTEIHRFVVDGETHYANAVDPSVPAAVASVVRGIRGLNNFRLKPAARVPQPLYTSTKGNHYLAPNDFATVYNAAAAYSAGFDGSGQKLVIAGQTQINLADIQQFRSSYGLPANDPQVILVPGSRDPGVNKNDLPEADLDIEWSGAVARNAAVIYVYANDVMQAAQYAIDQNLAPVVSTSYGSCEPETSSSDAFAMQSWARQANAQGITWFSASGDTGGADCNDSRQPGLAVDLPASIPEVTGVGGTEFSEGGGQYWNAANDANRASVLSYIPETTWNDSAADGQPAASGGGASVLFQKPSWQSAPGVPSDNARHVPDIAFNASADHDGYMVYTSGSTQVYGGTSVPAPAFAGAAALLNQYLVAQRIQPTPGLGNMNPRLYELARTVPDTFHDITAGDNIVTVACPKRNANCQATAVGYSAGAGYDQVTGLGSVDIYKLMTSWNGGNGSVSTPGVRNNISLVANSSSIAAQDVVFLTATVTGIGGVTPSGAVTFSSASSTLGTATLVGSAGTATATLSIQGAQLPPGGGAVTAVYSGDTSATAVTSVSVSSSAARAGAAPHISGLANGASFKQSYAPGMILSVFGSQLASTTQSAAALPLPVSMGGVAATVNGVAAPLYYVSPGQLNIQVPYETGTGPLVVAVNNNGQVVSQSFSAGAAAPGIFTDQNGAPVPNTSAARGQIATLFVTGAGAVSPAVSDGAAPAPGTALGSLPVPMQPAAITVGGVPAAIAFIGIPQGLAGVVQINYQVPGGIGVGVQPVVVTIGGVSSAAAKLSIVQ